MKIAIVTGIAGGIGMECARMLAQRGYAVVGMGRHESPELSELDGLDVTYLAGDISSAADRARLVETAAARGEIRVLVNVAGIAPRVRRISWR